MSHPIGVVSSRTLRMPTFSRTRTDAGFSANAHATIRLSPLSKPCPTTADAASVAMPLPHTCRANAYANSVSLLPSSGRRPHRPEEGARDAIVHAIGLPCAGARDAERPPQPLLARAPSTRLRNAGAPAHDEWIHVERDKIVEVTFDERAQAETRSEDVRAAVNRWYRGRGLRPSVSQPARRRAR